MASLNLSSNGPSISKSYQSVINAPAPSGAAASSPTYGQWAVFSVTAPLANAFQDSGNKESVLKVQSTGEGELVDLIDEFSDGRVQFAFVKVKDSNSGLPKNALIAWCGEGVPERTKGYFTSHMTAVAKLLHGYHVQITARSDRDLTPESIIRKVADASGSKYSSNDAPPPVAAATKPSIASKPVFTPTQSSGLPSRAARRSEANVDEDGWGNDAPPVTRTQLERVTPAYQPTKVNMRDLTSQKPATSSFSTPPPSNDRPDVVRGAYQPIGKVDIAEIRRQAKESGSLKDERPETVKGSYEPVGKVDIAAIRARAQKSEPAAPQSFEPAPQEQEEEPQQPPSLSQRSAAFSQGGPLTSMPKPKVVNKFGGGGSFTGTKAPVPGGFQAKTVPTAAPVGAAGRTFADQGGKTPAQLWAEKKARERGMSGSDSAVTPSGYTGAAPVLEQKSGNTGWQSGYSGKKWGAVDIQKTGGSRVSEQRTGEAPVEEEPEEETPASPAGGIGSIRDRFSGAAPMGAPAPGRFDRAPPPAPEPETSTKPNRGIPIPGLASAPAEEEEEEEDDDSSARPNIPPPPAVPRSPTPETPERESSPIRIAAPISKAAPVQDVHEDVVSPSAPVPTQSLNRAATEEEDDEPETGPDPGRFASQVAAASGTGAGGATSTPAAASAGDGERARAEFDYDAQEDNEISFQEGEILTDIQKLDPDWWMVTNSKGQQGLVPSNYLQLIEEEDTHMPAAAPAGIQAAAAAPPITPVTAAIPAATESQGKTAVAMYDYEAGEDNEISFPEDAVITNIEFPDDDWWLGEYKGKTGLFPAAYVQLRVDKLS